MAVLTIHSQAVHVWDGADDLSTSGELLSGDWDLIVISASAIRFALPVGFDGSETINAAVLNIFAGTGESGGNHKHRIRVLASTSQVLPTTGAGVSSATGGTEEKTIGQGTFSPVLDYTVTGTAAATEVDIKDILIEAQTAGRLDGGYVVVLIQPVSYDDDVHLQAHGIGNTTPATIDLEYTASTEASLEATLDGVTLDAEIETVIELSLEATIDGVTLSSLAQVGSQASLYATLDGVTLDAEALAANQLSFDVTLAGVTLSADAVMFLAADLAASLDGVTLDAYAVLPPYSRLDLDATLDGVTLESKSYSGHLTELDKTLDAVTLTAAAIVRSRNLHRLFADDPDQNHTLFA